MTTTMTLQQVFTRLSLTKREIHARMQSDRTFPAPIRLAEGGIAFDASDVDAYLAAHGLAPATGGAPC